LEFVLGEDSGLVFEFAVETAGGFVREGLRITTRSAKVSHTVEIAFDTETNGAHLFL
jgi:hypothetical protein